MFKKFFNWILGRKEKPKSKPDDGLLKDAIKTLDLSENITSDKATKITKETILKSLQVVDDFIAKKIAITEKRIVNASKRGEWNIWVSPYSESKIPWEYGDIPLLVETIEVIVYKIKSHFSWKGFVVETLDSVAHPYVFQISWKPEPPEDKAATI